MNQFEIVPHTGGKLRILASKNVIGHENKSDHAVKMYQLCFSLIDGSIRYAPFGGIGTDNVPNGSIPIPVLSDNEGYFGRICPACNEYFRTDAGGEEYYCPYCSHFEHTLAFTTSNQREYIKTYIQTIISALETKSDIEIDLDDIVANLPNNHSPFVYSEERQQKNSSCKSCKTRYDILGEFGCCPNCGQLNTLDVYNDNLNLLLKRINNSSLMEVEEEIQYNEWAEILKNCISDFEAMAKDIRDELFKIPATVDRKAELRSVSFQRIFEANESLSKWFGIDFMKGVSDEDKLFLNRCFQRRHILTHNSGVVDDKYIKNTNDTTVRINQKIRIEKDEAFHLIALMRAIGKKLFDGYSSIS
jgi:hypothetical protein